jgi:hypothetical protein
VLSEVVDPDIHSPDFDLDSLVFCWLVVGLGEERGDPKRSVWRISEVDEGEARVVWLGGVEVGKISGPERSVNFEFLSCIVEWFGCLVQN